MLLRSINGDSYLVVQKRYFFSFKESLRIGQMAQQSKAYEFISLLLAWPSFLAFFRSRQQVVVMLLCLLAQMQREEQSGSKPYFCSSRRIFLSTVMMLQPTTSPAFKGTPSANLHHGWSYISAIRYRLAGSTFSTFSIKFLKFSLTKSGKTQSPERIFLQSSAVLLSSKGKYPQTIANKMTPLDQISTSRPLYFLLLIISGEAQQGDPHAVFSNSPDLQVLLSPKSTIFKESFQSISRFQGLRSRCTMLSSCKYAIPLMICLKYLQACTSSNFCILTIRSNNSPFQTYSITRNRYLVVSIIYIKEILTSYIWMMLGCRMSFKIWISLDTLQTSATSMILAFTKIFIATFQPVGIWVANLTFPKVPQPMVLPNRQLPILFSFGCYYSIRFITNLKGMDLQYNVTEVEMGEFFSKMQKQGEEEMYDSKNELQGLIESTLHLEYEIYLSEEELKVYKIILAEKECEVKRLKEKQAKKNSKATTLNDSLKRLMQKIQEVKDGYKKISNHNKSSKHEEQSHRNQRLTLQQKKTSLYKKYCDLQQLYANILLQIQDYGEIQQQYHQLHSQNQEMQQQIDEFLERKREITSDEAVDRKEHLKNEVKKMYEKIKMAEKEDQSICQEYEINRRAYAELARTQNSINNKNVEIERLYSRIGKVKEDIKLKKWERGEKEREFYAVSQEEAQLKREAGAEAEYRENQRRIKERLNHNFKIIDSQADEEITKTGEKLIGHYQSCNLQSQEQLDQLINRFQKIKSKSKNT